VEEFFFKPAAALPAFGFLLGGNGWEDKPLPPNVRWIGHVFTRDHNALNSSALTVLNINRGSMARYGFSPPTRVFEAAGAGACLITDQWEGIELFLEPGKEVLVAKDGLEVTELLGNLSPVRAREIGRRGMKRIKAEHTYAHRADQLEKVLEGRFSNQINRPETKEELSV
jgi:spore maturation protein CgeB